jgi:hypothetical protein
MSNSKTHTGRHLLRSQQLKLQETCTQHRHSASTKRVVKCNQLQLHTRLEMPSVAIFCTADKYRVPSAHRNNTTSPSTQSQPPRTQPLPHHHASPPVLGEVVELVHPHNHLSAWQQAVMYSRPLSLPDGYQPGGRVSDGDGQGKEGLKPGQTLSKNAWC